MLYAYAIDMTSVSDRSYLLSIAENKDYLSMPTQRDERKAIHYAKAVISNMSPLWSVNVINVKTGAKVLQKELSQPTYTMDTSQWEPGIYVVRAFTGGDVIFAEKITVK